MYVFFYNIYKKRKKGQVNMYTSKIVLLVFIFIAVWFGLINVARLIAHNNLHWFNLFSNAIGIVGVIAYFLQKVRNKMQERKTYKVELTDTQKERLDKLLEFVGSDDYIKLKEIKQNNETVKEEEFPKKGDDYYYITSNGEISKVSFIGIKIDLDSVSIGNCFKTKEEAEFELERLKVLTEIKKFAEPEDKEWDGYNSHWSICYAYDESKLKYNTTFYKRNDIYFESIEMAHKCIDSIGEDRIKKYYLRVEDQIKNEYLHTIRKLGGRMKYIAIIDSDNELSEDAIKEIKETVFVGDEKSTYCFDITSIKKAPKPMEIILHPIDGYKDTTTTKYVKEGFNQALRECGIE